jgi:hypothetical protein
VKSRLSIVALLGCVLISVSASSAAADTQYQSATTAKLTMSSPEFEYVGQGRAWDFETPAFDVLTLGDPCQCFVGARAQNFDTALPEDFQWSFLYFQVPSGQIMTSGTTYSTRRWPFQQASESGLDVTITSRGCNESVGEFTVLDVAFAANGDIRRFHATFKQYCELGSVPLQGEIDIVKIPPPRQTTTITIDTKGSLNRTPKQAVVHGTVKCEVPGPVKISGTVTQGKSTGNFDNILLDCSDTVATWTASVASTSSRDFANGAATVKAQAAAPDPNYSDADGAPLIAKSEQIGSVELDR